ncbi:MAG: DUF4177 domain-containing protein [Desulfocapsaceae bacterium]
MNWSYKTVHFELKKEGILGGGFLDETEIEEQLNDYGRSGWELISVIEVQSGVIAFFKQPVAIRSMMINDAQVVQGESYPESFAASAHPQTRPYTPDDEHALDPDPDEAVFEDESELENGHDYRDQDLHYDSEVEYIEEDIPLEPDDDGVEVFEEAAGDEHDNQDEPDEQDTAESNTIGAIRIE